MDPINSRLKVFLQVIQYLVSFNDTFIILLSTFLDCSPFPNLFMFRFMDSYRSFWKKLIIASYWLFLKTSCPLRLFVEKSQGTPCYYRGCPGISPLIKYTMNKSFLLWNLILLSATTHTLCWSNNSPNKRLWNIIYYTHFNKISVV